MNDPARLMDEAERWAAALAERGLLAEPVAAALREALVQSRSERLDMPEDPLLVTMLCGPTAVGKSSLINSLAGADISRPGLGAATAAAVIYVHERDNPARLFEYSQALGELGRAEASLVRHARDELLHKVLVDTPDIDSAVRRHRDTTEALVHCADLVLFVTSPEKYKTMQGAAWIAQQRQQRAIAFVLNKWDRDALGLQHEQRQLLDDDFRAVLAQIGFPDPLVFKVSSAAAQADGGPAGIENELPALAAWLAAGLDRSAAADIRERRQRAGWGRLGAALASAVPMPLSGHDFGGLAAGRLATGRVQSAQLAKTEVLSLVPVGLDGDARPMTPGLLGGWIRLAGRIGQLAHAMRAVLAWRGPAGNVDSRAVSFGGAAAALLARATGELAEAAAVMRVSLGPVPVGWASETRELSERLAVLPGEVEGELAGPQRPSLRRATGIGVLYAIEALVTLVLLTAFWRLGSGFILSDYPSSGLLLNTIALLVVLLLLGQLAGNLLFLPFQERFRRNLAQRAETIIEAHWQRAAVLLTEQLEAIDRLAQQGQALLAAIDEIVATLTPAKPDGGDVVRLFGEKTAGLVRRQPVFE
jgi:energy-coupling factor transporter ATP-binding protein EcfA2